MCDGLSELGLPPEKLTYPNWELSGSAMGVAKSIFPKPVYNKKTKFEKIWFDEITIFKPSFNTFK
jgi:hypothetical protein